MAHSSLGAGSGSHGTRLEETEAYVNLLLTLAMAVQGGNDNVLGWLPLQLAGFALVFYFLIMRPQAQARKRHAELLSKLKKGDEVMTSGGIIGRVKDIKQVEADGQQETRVTVESGTSTVVVERSRIVRVGASPTQPAPPA
jgi:preprotein translocase subunit YajC